MKKQTESELVSKLRGERSFRDFESYLNEKIPAEMPGTTTFASAWNWVNSVHPVNGACLMAWMAYYPGDDKRHQLAKDILALRSKSIPEYSIQDTEKLMRLIGEKEVIK
jgi:hypothetical protein